MNRKTYMSILALLFLAISFLTGCCSSAAPAAISITPVTGTTPQSATVGTAFATNLSVTVMQGTTPVSGATVTFTAPAQTGASGTFAGGVNTATTNASGVATAATFTANAIAGAYTVTASTSGASTPASFSLTNTAGAAAMVVATGGNNQSVTVNTAFAPLAATVEDSYGNPVLVSGTSVTFTVVAGGSGASASFAKTGATDTETTNANGVATTSQTLTANATAGGFTVTASSGTLTSANFTETNTAVVVSSNTYVFYLSGLEAIDNDEEPNFYAIAGAVTIDSNGSVTAGEEDYNDGFADNGGILDAPTTISGGTLAVDPSTGQGTLTLTTGDPNLGNSGTETLGVQFVNANHALIVQFDGSATSSGSLDLQTATQASGNFAFTFSGVDGDYAPSVVGGVFSVSQLGAVSGTFDINDDGTVTTGGTFPGTASSPDPFGRGTVIGTPLAGTVAYYIVGPEVMRFIGDDNNEAGVGSAFGQGDNSFSDASLGTSVFGILDNPWDAGLATAGMFTTDGDGNITAGVADDDEYGSVLAASPIDGDYSIAGNGYGSLFLDGDGDVGEFGIYLTDPNLNLNDPNNPSGGGGALVLETDGAFFGTGVVIPQTDNTVADFTGNYAFGMQEYDGGGTSGYGWEFDLVGQASVSGTDLDGTGLVSDPFGFFTGSGAEYSAVPFTGTAVPDATNLGRYTMTPLDISIAGSEYGFFNMAIYQASGNQLFWMEEDDFGLSLGLLEKQGPPYVSAVKKAAAKSAKPKQKQ